MSHPAFLVVEWRGRDGADTKVRGAAAGKSDFQPVRVHEYRL